MLALSKLVNNNDVIASIIGNMAAGLECEKEEICLLPNEVINKFKNLRDIRKIEFKF